MPKTPTTNPGTNRTGLQASPMDAKDLEQIAGKGPSPDCEGLELNTLRGRYAKEMNTIGSVPPPGSMKGMATTGMEMLKGHKPTVFIDKLGERLAFERTGVRMYEALLIKHDALGSWDGGPTRQDLVELHNDELEHFNLVKETMKRLGADPTSMTPSADMTAVEAMGPAKVITDLRTTMPQALHAILVLEDTDVEGWKLLIELADSIGQNSLAERFREAEQVEERHQQKVRQWLSSAVLADAQNELGTQGRA